MINALALFWVTDSRSERSTGVPLTATAVLDHPVYEMSSRMSSRHKDPGASVGELVPTNPRLSRRSWSPLMALDRSFRTMFVREPAPRETGTIDVEVSLRFDWVPCSTEVKNVRSRSTPRRTSMFTLLMMHLEKQSKTRLRPFPGPRIACVSSGCRRSSI